jgi:hypothetical protein
MNCVVMRSVPYRLPGKGRIVWAIVLGQREGLTLLFVERPDNSRSHTIVIATEDVATGVFYDTRASRFPMEPADLPAIGSRLMALSENLSEREFRTLFELDDL